MLFCPNCGFKIENLWNNCPECGAILREQKIINAFQPSPPNQPTYQPTYQPIKFQKRPDNYGYGIVALICGILGFFLYFWLFGIIAIICGAVGQKKDATKGLATAGLVLGILNLCYGFFTMISLLSLFPYM
jgi:hypothetical protein